MLPTDDFNMPIPPVAKQAIPDNKAKELAFYGSHAAGESITPAQHLNMKAKQAISDFHETTYDRIYTDLKTQGESGDLNAIHKSVGDDEDQQSKDAITRFITDPSVDNPTKIAALQGYNARAPYTSLRDRFLTKAAVEDHADTEEDRSSHDMLLNSFQESKDKQQELQMLISGYAKNLNPTGTFSEALGSIVGGVARDAVIPGAYAGATLAALKMAGKDVGFAKGLLLHGTTVKDIGREYDSMSDDQKLEFAKAVLPAIAKIPGTDWNKYELMNNFFETPDMHWGWETFDNLISMADAVVFGKFISAPAKTISSAIRWFKPDLKSFTLNSGAKTASQAGARIDPTFTPQGGAHQAPTGKGLETTPTSTGTDVKIPAVGEFVGKDTLGMQKQIESPDLKRFREAKVVEDAIDIVPGTGEIVNKLEGQKLLEYKEQVDAVHYVYTPKVAPNSVLGVMSKINPQKASKARVEALLDDSDKRADSMGTSKGEILSDALPGWVKNVDDVHPDIAEKLRANDKYFNDVLNENVVDPNFVDIVARNADKTVIYNAFKEARGGHYQQSNSTMVDSLTDVSGTALFGRNAEFGWSRVEDAQQALKDIQESVPALDKVNAKVVNRNNQFYVEYNYAKKYDPFTEFAMGSQTISANIYPIPFSDFAINADALARSTVGRALFPPTTMYDPWIPKAAAGATMRASKIESDFIRVIKDDILSVAPKKELGAELRLVQENQVWKDYKDLAASNAHLSEAEVKDLYKGYVNYRRLTDYQYEWANVADRKIRVAQNQEAIYKTDGTHIGYGARVSGTELDNVKYVWDMDADTAVKLVRDTKGELQLNGRTVVRMDGGINKSADELGDVQSNFQRMSDDNIFEYAIVGNKTELRPLPHRTLQRIEGYIPRQNIESWYVKKIPKVVRRNGDELVTDPAALKGFNKTVGAEWSEARAGALKARFEKEHPNYTFEIARDRNDSASSIVADYKVFQGMLEHSKKRGDRLPTLDGKARLEDPIEALSSAIRSSVRMGVWSDYQDVFKKNYIDAFGEFVQKGQFPNVVTDLVRPAVESKEALAKFQAAQQLFKQYANQQYKVTVGDDVWKSFFHGVGDVLEKFNVRGLSEGARDIAGSGNAFVKIPKTLGSTLFLHLNPPRQWLVQTQQLTELTAMSPSFARHLNTIPAIGMAVLSKASYMGKAGNGVYRAAQKMSGMSPKEFDEVFDAIYKSGIPQSVDLNMMLHGMYDDMKLTMDKSVGREAFDRVANVVKTPGTIGKTIGYTPAELSNTIGVWLFNRDRWIKNNPGKNWNTPQNIARISGDAWDMTNSMSTRAGSLPYQDGFMSLFFQFAAVQQKSLMTLMSGKTLSKNERGRLIAARTAIWGMYGTAMGGVLNELVTHVTDPEFQAKWHEYKGGLMDVITNKLIMDSFREAGEKESTLAVSGSMSPMPSSHPLIQVVEELSKAIDGAPTNPRFAFTGAVGSVYEAAKDIKNMFTANEFDTPEALKMVMRELAETTSGYNNFAKAMMIHEAQNKIDKVGRSLDLEMTGKEVAAQMLGVITREEQMQYAMSNAKFEEDAFVKQRAKELDEFMRKNQQNYKTEVWDEYMRRFRNINSVTPQHLRDRVEDEFHSLQAKQLKSGKESNFAYILNNIRQANGTKLNEMIGYLMASKDKESQELLQKLKDEGLIEGTK